MLYRFPEEMIAKQNVVEEESHVHTYISGKSVVFHILLTTTDKFPFVSGFDLSLCSGSVFYDFTDFLDSVIQCNHHRPHTTRVIFTVITIS